MKILTELLSPGELVRLASRSHYRFGKEILEDGQIVFSKKNTFSLTAEVSHKNSERRTVDIQSTPKGLRWKCSCTGRKDLFCEHVVAVGMALHPSTTSEE